MIYIGIDNGVTGSIAILRDSDPAEYYNMPVQKHVNYQKKLQNIKIDYCCW